MAQQTVFPRIRGMTEKCSLGAVLCLAPDLFRAPALMSEPRMTEQNAQISLHDQGSEEESKHHGKLIRRNNTTVKAGTGRNTDSTAEGRLKRLLVYWTVFFPLSA